jgi:hypothetical protein
MRKIIILCHIYPTVLKFQVLWTYFKHLVHSSSNSTCRFVAHYFSRRFFMQDAKEVLKTLDKYQCSGH